MADWEEKLNQFLQFNGREILLNAGKVKREIAEKLALDQYKQYDANRRAAELEDMEVLTEEIKRQKP